VYSPRIRISKSKLKIPLEKVFILASKEINRLINHVILIRLITNNIGAMIKLVCQMLMICAGSLFVSGAEIIQIRKKSILGIKSIRKGALINKYISFNFKTTKPPLYRHNTQQIIVNLSKLSYQSF